MTRGQERAVLAATLAGALLLVGAQAWSLWVRLSENTMPMAAAASVAGYAATVPEPDLQVVMAFAPFGRAEGATAPETPAPAAVAVDLTLLGITLSATSGASRAIIATADSPAQSYGIGDTLPSGAVLALVAADHVVIAGAGGETALHFPEAPSAGPRPEPQAQTEASGPDLVNLIPAAAPSQQALLTGIRLAMSQDPQAYVAGLGLSPDSGGYRVRPDMDQALRAAGLQPGDLVRSVNGQTPGDPARDLAILDTVAAAGTALLQVNRDGQTLTLTVPLP